MKLVGVTGGIGSGKSYVCRLLEAQGYPCYYADDRAKLLMVADPVLREGLTKLFGEQTYKADGSLNRAYLAKQIFGDAAKLAQMNALVHPAVGQDSRRWLKEESVANGKAFALREAAILFESGAYKDCDLVVTVYAPEATRLARVLERGDKTAPEAVLARMAKQLPEQQKMLAADFVVCNDGVHALSPQIEQLIALASA
jgi:dephospho-CoA kinase